MPLLVGHIPLRQSLGHFRWVVTAITALQKVYIPYRSLIEALYTLNSPPVVSFKKRRGYLMGLGV